MVDEMLATCPEALKFSAKHLVWEYPGGSIRLGGGGQQAQREPYAR